MAKPDQSQLNLTVTTGTNAGAAGGDTNYINLGGLKICWGTVAPMTLAAGGEQFNLAITFPISYTTAPKVTVTANGIAGNGGYTALSATTGTSTTTGATAALHNFGSGSATGTVNWLAIGV